MCNCAACRRSKNGPRDHHRAEKARRARCRKVAAQLYRAGDPEGRYRMGMIKRSRARNRFWRALGYPNLKLARAAAKRWRENLKLAQRRERIAEQTRMFYESTRQDL